MVREGLGPEFANDTGNLDLPVGTNSLHGDEHFCLVVSFHFFLLPLPHPLVSQCFYRGFWEMSALVLANGNIGQTMLSLWRTPFGGLGHKCTY